MCTQLIDGSPARYKHQRVHGILHQSDGGRSGADQPQQTAPTSVWSEPHQGPNRFKKEGGSSRFQKLCDFLLKAEERRRKGGSEILARGSSAWRTQREGSSNPSSFDQEHSRCIDSSDRSLQIRFAELGFGLKTLFEFFYCFFYFCSSFFFCFELFRINTSDCISNLVV